jgi:hypothetical protein
MAKERFSDASQRRAAFPSAPRQLVSSFFRRGAVLELCIMEPIMRLQLSIIRVTFLHVPEGIAS